MPTEVDTVQTNSRNELFVQAVLHMRKASIPIIVDLNLLSMENELQWIKLVDIEYKN